MEVLKKYILDFYKTHDSNVALRFHDVKKHLNMSDIELDTLLRSLASDGFIRPIQNADNIMYLFCINR